MSILLLSGVARRRGVRLAGILCSLVVIGGCSSDDSAVATTPTPAAVSTLTVAGGPNVYIGETLQLTATLNLSDGTIQTPNCAWGGDNPSVATVTAGLATGQGSGEESIWCDANGMRGTKLVRGLPDYGGTWTGVYTVTGCTQSGDLALANVCASYPMGSTASYQWNFTQLGDIVSGTFALGGLTFTPITAPVPLGGTIGFTGRSVSDTSTLTATWQANIPRPNTLIATVAQTLTRSGSSGEADIAGTVTMMTRTMGNRVGHS